MMNSTALNKTAFENLFTESEKTILRKDDPRLTAEQRAMFGDGETELTLVSKAGLKRILPLIGTQEAQAFSAFMDHVVDPALHGKQARL